MLKNYKWNELSEIKKQEILLRPIQFVNKDIEQITKNIIDQVKLNKDKALVELTEKYDQVLLETLEVNRIDYKNALKQISSSAKDAILFAKKQIETYHLTQLPLTQSINTYSGVVCERQPRAIESVGLYVPGGSAPLISTLLMLAIPAKIAKCPLIILCTPPNKEGYIDPHLLFAAELCNITYIYKVGGAQAIAAMAYGTETIPKVSKIFGPGNAWVTQAKMEVSKDPYGAAIDMPAGPSELMVVADESANPEYVAADLLSQAEHGVDSQVILIVLSKKFVLMVEKAINKQILQLPRIEIIKKTLSNSRAIIVENINQAITISNRYAPEHLILSVNNPRKYMNDIENAGAVFLGKWAPETVGDYVTGSNHVLPTYGYARQYSGLNVLDFMKYINFQTVTKKGLQNIGPYAEILADIEGLKAHKQAVSYRLARENNNVCT